jgi:hypothetical protein
MLGVFETESITLLKLFLLTMPTVIADLIVALRIVFSPVSPNR